MGWRSNGLDHPLREISSRSNGCCYPFENNLHPFEQLRLSTQKKWSPVRTADVIHLKETGVVRMANVYRSRKINILCIQLFEQLLRISPFTQNYNSRISQRYLTGFKFSNDWESLFRRNFIQLPEWLCLFKTNLPAFQFRRPRLSILKEKLYLKSWFKK